MTARIGARCGAEDVENTASIILCIDTLVVDLS
jgi:hypothetical protein